jgi:nucleoside-triphosphatase
LALKIFLVTGVSGSGKTTFCREMARAAQRHAWQIAGLLSLPEFTGPEKTGIWAQDLRSGEKRLLASVKRQEENDLLFGKWFFNRQMLDWGNDVLKASIPCDLLVVDELGPLELKLSQGWTNALDVIRTGRYRLALVVIRPELLEMVQPILNFSQVISLSKVDEVAEKILQYSSLFDGIHNPSTQ